MGWLPLATVECRSDLIGVRPEGPRSGTPRAGFRLLGARMVPTLLVDAWPDVVAHLPEDIRRRWAPLVRSVAEAGLDDLLVVSLRKGRPRPVNQKARARAIERLAAHGLTADEIRAVLRRR